MYHAYYYKYMPQHHIRRNKMKKRSQKYVKVIAKVEKGKLYTKEEAIKLAKETNVCNFDASVEVAIRLNLDSKKADQQLRGAMVLPHGTGKVKKVIVIAKGEQASLAKTAGADFVGDSDLIEKIEKEKWLDFDVVIATPEMMPALGKIGKLLGPKGLMPNPKTGTVTMDVKKAVEDVKKGRIEYKTDSFSIIHAIIGKCSFDEEQLIGNLDSFVDVILRSKPTTSKGIYVKSVVVSTTMGPGIKIDPNSFDKQS
jgi:large subunit ribosomal protein L1